jgi:hypothetical protein
MNKELISKIEALFSNPKDLTMGQIEQFVHDTLKFFDGLKERLEAGTEEEKQEALKEAQEVQEVLQKHAQSAYAKIGMNEEQVKKYLSAVNFSSSDKTHFQNAEKEIADFQKNLKEPS